MGKFSGIARLLCVFAVCLALIIYNFCGRIFDDVSAGTNAFAASSETEDINGATELVKCMSGEESGIRIWEMSKSFPSTYGAFENIDVFQTDENYSALYNQLSNYGHPRPKTPVYPQVSTSFQEVLESVALGGKDTDAELDKAVERINAKLERYTRE